MTNTTKTFENILRLDLGFEDDWNMAGEGWLVHESEPVRFAWEDEESGAFALFRFEARYTSSFGPLVNQMRADNLDPDTFRAVIRGFLHA